MPDPAGTKNNGGIKFVRQTVTIKDTEGADTVYILQKGSIKAPSKRVVQEDENGVEARQAFMKQTRTGSLTLQFIEDTDKPPAQFEEFTAKDTTGANVTLIASEVDQDFGADSPAGITITAYEKLT